MTSTTKADQIAYRFYTKLALVLQDARSTADLPKASKTDKWFNLETPDTDAFRESFKVYRSVSTNTPPPCELQVLLVVPELSANQVLVCNALDGSRRRIEPTPRYILLESWNLDFATSAMQNEQVAPSTSYKHGIPLFRSVFTLLRLLPAWKLYKRLRRRTGGNNRNGNLNMQLRIRTQGDSQDGILSFNTPPARNASALSSETHTFPAIPHSSGNLTLSTTFLSSPNFQLDELESLLSSRFLSLDEESEFTPTLAKNQQRDSISGSRISDSRNRVSGSPGSLPIRTSLPRSPPSNYPPQTPSSIADRFVLPLNRTASEQSPRNVPLPMGRFSASGGPSETGSGVASSPKPSSSYASSHKDESRVPPIEEEKPASWNAREASGLAARLRKESTGRGGGSDLPNAPLSSPVRRPNIFKSSTLSSSPSLLTQSPSVNSPSTSLRQTSPLSAFPPRPLSVSSRQSQPSPIGIGNRPSPSNMSGVGVPFSLGDRRSLASGDGEVSPSSLSQRPSTRKRYSSSFGHRYNTAGSGGGGSYATSGGTGSYAASAGSFPGSQGSGGSGERREDKNVSTSFLSTNTDDDNISVFMQDIDSRKPLAGHHRSQSASGAFPHPPGLDRNSPSPDLHPLIASGAASISPDTSTMPTREGSVGGSSSTTVAPMLTTESEVDEKLRQMNAAFMASLQGLGGGKPKRRERERAGSEDTQRPSVSAREREFATVGRGMVKRGTVLPLNRETAHRSVSLVDPTHEGSRSPTIGPPPDDPPTPGGSSFEESVPSPSRPFSLEARPRSGGR